MNRTFEIIKIIVAICVIVIIGVGIVISFSGGKSMDNYGAAQDKKITENITDVKINWNSDEVTIKKSPDNTTRIVEKSSDTGKSRLSYDVSNNKLTIKKTRNPFFIFNFFYGRSNLEVYLPDKEYESIKLDYTSGRYDVSDIKTKNLKIDSTSGVVSLDRVTAKRLDISSTSGSIDFNGSTEDVDLNMTSGKSKIESTTMLKALNVELTSGGATVSIPENNGFVAKTKVTSGSFKSDFEFKSDDKTYQYKNGGPEFNIRLTSGKMRLNKN